MYINQIKVSRKKSGGLESKGRDISAIEEDISNVEFRYAIGSIINELFLNKKTNITRNNMEIVYKEVS